MAGTKHEHRKRGSKKARQQAHNQQTGRYKKQFLRTAKNKALARQKHLANNPNDLQAAENIRKSVAWADQKLME